jgi:hypothetical protein
MFGIKDEISSGIGRTMKPERSDGSDLRWKRSETKTVLAGRKQVRVITKLPNSEQSSPRFL